jgi:hypothetical protein
MRGKITANAFGGLFGDGMVMECHADELNGQNNHRDIKRDPKKTVRISMMEFLAG